MINVKSIDIDDCYGVDFLYLTINVTDMVKPPEQYRIDLYKSTNQADLFVKIGSDIELRYRDSAVNLMNRNMSYYYKVVITDLETQEVYTSPNYRYNAVPADRWSLAIEEVEKRYLENVVDNREVYILQRKWSGPHCSCWNPNREDVDDSYCELCYGTGILGGYYNPQIAHIAYYNTPAEETVFSQAEDTDHPTPIQAWIQNVPKIQNRDIIVDGPNRYIVTSHTDLIKNHHLIRQLCILSLLPRTNIVSRIPIL